jgi:hypothetical protein
MSLNLSLACGAKSLFYSLCKEDEIILIDRTTLAGLTNAHKDLLAAKWLCGTASLDDV